MRRRERVTLSDMGQIADILASYSTLPERAIRIGGKRFGRLGEDSESTEGDTADSGSESEDGDVKGSLGGAGTGRGSSGGGGGTNLSARVTFTFCFCMNQLTLVRRWKSWRWRC